MIDLNLIRTNPKLVKDNLRKKFQEEKLPLVDKVLTLDEKYRSLKQKADSLRETRNKKSKEIGRLVRDSKFEEINKIKEEVNNLNKDLEVIEKKEQTLILEIKKDI